MTSTTFLAVNDFLIAHQALFWDDMRVADYGGTDTVRGGAVRKLLEEGDLKNYHQLDFETGVDLREPIKGEKFDLGICMDLLEHTSNPFVVAKNIIDSLNKDAYLFVTVPFVWHLHTYPDDFWRFTPHGLSELFKEMETETVYSMLDTYEIPEDEKQIVPVSLPFSRVIGIFKKK